MLPNSPLAQQALAAIQEAVPPGKTHYERGQAVINLTKLMPSGSALARALLSDNVWSSTSREQHFSAWSGNPQYANFRHIGSGGHQMHYFLTLINKAAAADGSSQIEERHIARALAGEDGKNLQDMGINGNALVAEVTRMETATAAASAPKAKSVAVRLEGLHPLIQEAAASRFGSGHYEDAIFAAFRAVEGRVRTLSGLDLSGRKLMEGAFGGESPVIRVATGQDRSARDEQEGFRFIFMGATQGIRNPKAHDEVEQRDPQRTLEYLAFASLLMRRLDDAETTGRS